MQELIIQPNHGDRAYWQDLWRRRELLYFLVWRDVRVRYKQTVLGIGWAVLRPLLTVVVFTLVFGRMAGLRAPGGVPYSLMVFAALLPWQLFASCLSECGNSLVGNSSLISKIYFPRLIIPTGCILAGLIDFAITLAMVGMLMAGSGFVPDWRIVALPVVAVILLANALGAGLWLAALNAKYRDFRHLIPFVVQLGIYVSPIGFSTQVVPARWRFLYALNPMVGVIDGFRWCLLRGQVVPAWTDVVCSVIVSAGLCLSGVWYFRRMEKTLADVI
ncbi:MAG TPA: ABC transporter permease [Verrucomicrobiae bacterium]|nr:ABC transporter permease [Verrucomicrobiae bacterium]